jgi:AhpD family alkylhydroperoxidase
MAALTRAASALDHGTAELIKTRVSQINGCAYCVDLHASALRTAGEHPRRVDALAVWRDSPLFDEGERAALALAEALTLLPAGTPDPELYAEAARHWSAEEVALIVMTTIGINAWNRYMIATGAEVPPLSD